MKKWECEVDGLFLIIAGSDTTASVIRITMLYLMTCPQVYRKLKDEIAASIRDGKASYPISLDEARKLPYLQVCSHHTLCHCKFLLIKFKGCPVRGPSTAPTRPRFVSQSCSAGGGRDPWEIHPWWHRNRHEHCVLVRVKEAFRHRCRRIPPREVYRGE